MDAGLVHLERRPNKSRSGRQRAAKANHGELGARCCDQSQRGGGSVGISQETSWRSAVQAHFCKRDRAKQAARGVQVGEGITWRRDKGVRHDTWAPATGRIQIAEPPPPKTRTVVGRAHRTKLMRMRGSQHSPRYHGHARGGPRTASRRRSRPARPASFAARVVTLDCGRNARAKRCTRTPSRHARSGPPLLVVLQLAACSPGRLSLRSTSGTRRPGLANYPSEATPDAPTPPGPWLPRTTLPAEEHTVRASFSNAMHAPSCRSARVGHRQGLLVTWRHVGRPAWPSAAPRARPRGPRAGRRR